MANQKFQIDSSNLGPLGIELSKIEIVGSTDKFIIGRDSDGKMLYCDVQQILDLINEGPKESQSSQELQEGQAPMSLADGDLELLSDAGTFGIVGGNSIALTSLNRQNMPDGDASPTQGLYSFANFTGSTGYPTQTGGGIWFRGYTSSTNAQFIIWTPLSSNDLYVRNGSGEFRILMTQTTNWGQENMAAGTVIDFNTLRFKNKAISADTTLTFNNQSDGAWCSVRIANTDTVDHTVTITGATMADGSDMLVPAGGRSVFSFQVMNGVVFGTQSKFTP